MNKSRINNHKEGINKQNLAAGLYLTFVLSTVVTVMILVEPLFV